MKMVAMLYGMGFGMIIGMVICAIKGIPRMTDFMFMAAVLLALAEILRRMDRGQRP